MNSVGVPFHPVRVRRRAPTLKEQRSHVIELLWAYNDRNNRLLRLRQAYKLQDSTLLKIHKLGVSEWFQVDWEGAVSLEKATRLRNQRPRFRFSDNLICSLLGISALLGGNFVGIRVWATLWLRCHRKREYWCMSIGISRTNFWGNIGINFGLCYRPFFELVECDL